MFQSFYTGLSGMFSFSKNLDVVSNNIANMNTPGYKGSDAFYQSLGSDDQLGGGYGTQISGLGYRFAAGDVKQTGNETDLAISGQGMFVLIQGDQLLYTRSGQFAFDDNGVLVDKISGLEVAQLDNDGNLTKIDISGLRTKAPSATSEINLVGNISSDETEVTVDDITVFNALGETSTVSIKLTNDFATTDGQWLVDVLDEDGNSIETGTIRFDSDGTPLNGSNSLSFNLSDSLGGTSTATIQFGESGDYSGTTSTSTGSTSSVRLENADGYAISTITSANFDASGQLTIQYSNGQEEKGAKLAMARFGNEAALSQYDGSIFSAVDNSSRTIDVADSNGFGKIISESLEMSNVDLSKEFADMIIIQRGYQASSKILNVANQMLEQLYESTRGR